MPENSTKAGLVAIIGEPNVGKSTLMNAILGTKLSIVTAKPQTTRKSILGIYSEGDVQMVFYDTPGVLSPRYELQRNMMEFVRSSIEGADVLLVVLDVTHITPNKPTAKAAVKAAKRGESKPTTAAAVKNEHIRTLYDITKKLKTTFEEIGKPVVVALNKMDALHDRKQALPVMEALMQTGVVKQVYPISALENKVVDDLVAALASYMPEHEFYYDAELLSEMPQRFFVSEIIREVIFKSYREEIPYSTEVNIAEFKEREEGKWYIAAEIIIERNTQKAIIIGKQGVKLKEVGQKARLAIEEYLEMPVFLELFVKVREDWRDNPTYLRSFGYGTNL